MECWTCGKLATTTLVRTVYETKEPTRFLRCYCEECAKKVYAQNKADEKEYVRLKKKQMLNSALCNLESQNVDMYKLKPAIEKVQTYIENYPDKFDSSYEMLAAIILIDNGVKFQMQKRILNYQVDFCIPSHKIILEVDGERHKSNKSYDRERDEKIIDEMGYDWNIIRIGTDNLDKKATKLIKAIDQVMKYRATGKVNWREI